jgi:hypothetical protein
VRSDTYLIFTAYDEYRVFDCADAEKNLMRAILQSAMEDMHKRGEAYRDARRYFMSNDERYIYSFVNVCHHLELSPRTIRSRLGLYDDARSDSDMAAA